MKMTPNNVRGLILQALNADPHHMLSNMALISVLHGYGVHWSKSQVNGEIKYLEDKKYVRSTVLYRELWEVQLTAEGVDLLEGRVTDPGVILLKTE